MPMCSQRCPLTRFVRPSATIHKLLRYCPITEKLRSDHTFTLTRKVFLKKMSDLNEIWICYREKNSKVEVSELIGHNSEFGGKKGA